MCVQESLDKQNVVSMGPGVHPVQATWCVPFIYDTTPFFLKKLKSEVSNVIANTTPYYLLLAGQLS